MFADKGMKFGYFAVILLITGLIFAGCNKKEIPVAHEEPSVSPTQGTQQNTQPEVPNKIEYTKAPVAIITDKSVRDMADLVFADASPADLLRYVRNHMESVGTQEADSLLLILENVQRAWLSYYQSGMSTSSSKSEKKTALLESFQKDGFRLNTIRGRDVPAIDYSLYREWENKLSDWFQDYLFLAQMEADTPVVCNGKLNIPIDALEERLMKASEYVEKYPQSIRVNEVLNFYDLYLFAYLYGYEPDLVFDFETQRVSSETFIRYREFAVNHPEADVSGLISEYAGIIERGSFLLTDEIQAFIENLFSSLEDKRIVVRKDIGKQILMERVQGLLPKETGFFWQCYGSAEYAHSAVLENIHTEDGNPVYTLTGQVDDSLNGAISQEEADIWLQYRIDKNVMSQNKTAPWMMDSDFDELELIRYPFIPGHCWYQYPKVTDLNTYAVETEILGVSQEDGMNLYEVEYRNMTTGGRERRLIQAGKGTVAFTKLYSEDATQVFEIGYAIDEEKTGYIISGGR